MPKSLERRVDRLEELVGQQGYVVRFLLVIFAFDTAAILLLWQSHGQPDYDHIAVALTVFQTGFGIAALYGFWALRGLTKERAEEVAEEIALAEVRKLIPSIVAREIRDNVQAFPTSGTISNADAQGMVDAIGASKEGERGQSDADSGSPSEGGSR